MDLDKLTYPGRPRLKEYFKFFNEIGDDAGVYSREDWYNSFATPGAPRPTRKLGDLISEYEGRPWRPGDPCGNCGSINTHMDWRSVAWCATCNASDEDE